MTGPEAAGSDCWAAACQTAAIVKFRGQPRYGRSLAEIAGLAASRGRGSCVESRPGA